MNEEADTGEIEAVDDDYDREVTQIRILAELEAIRYRLGVLVAFLVVIPLAVTFVVFLITAD